MSAVLARIGRGQWINRGHHIAVLVIARVARHGRRGVAAGAVGRGGGGPAGLRGAPAGDASTALVIARVLALPDMPAGIIDLAVGDLVHIVVVLPATAAVLDVGGLVLPLLRDRGRIGTAGHLLDQVMVARAEATRGGQIIVGPLNIHPGRVAALALEKGGFRFHRGDLAGRVDRAERAMTGVVRIEPGSPDGTETPV